MKSLDRTNLFIMVASNSPHKRRAAEGLCCSFCLRSLPQHRAGLKADLGCIPAVLAVKYCAEGTEVSSPWGSLENTEML